jgi:GLPGLI family protein
MKYIFLFSIFSLHFSFCQNNVVGEIEYTETFGVYEKVDYKLSFTKTFSIYEQNKIQDDSVEIINGFKEPKIKRKYFTDISEKKILFKEGIAYQEVLTKDTINIQWEIHNEQKIIGGFNCLKATTKFKKNNYTAWFTTEIPFFYGPWKFNSLPGVILEISDDTKFYQIIATKITLGKEEENLTKKLLEFTKDKPISMKEYNYLRKKEDEDIYYLLISKAGRETYLKVTTDYTGFLREPFD